MYNLIVMNVEWKYLSEKCLEMTGLIRIIWKCVGKLRVGNE